ncbi:MAG TPA: hypothetical protein VHX61_05425 [Rhizomicrobium sp.]|nr:hypothetical protein [Rhizomicrobium sp.]
MGRNGDLNAERELRITTAAQMIEAYCINKVPEGIKRDARITKRLGPAYRLADAIERIMRRTGACTKKDLIGTGFREADVKRHWRFAYELASAQLNMTDA